MTHPYDLRSFNPPEPGFIVLWIDDEQDRNSDGLPVNGFEAGQYYSLKDARFAALEGDAKPGDPNREVVILSKDEWEKCNSETPLEILWTNQPERYLEEKER